MSCRRDPLRFAPSLRLVVALGCLSAGAGGIAPARGAAGPGASAPTPAPVISSAASSYERWIAPRLLDPDERILLRAVRTWGHRRRLTLAYDGRLARAAQTLLPWAHDHAGEPFPVAALQQRAWELGWTDGELAAVAVTGRRAELEASLRRELEALLGHDGEIDQVGLAVDNNTSGDGGGRASLVVALSRRIVHLAPVPKQVVVDTEFTLAGQVPAVRELSAMLACPDGRLQRLALAHDGGQFMASLGTGHQAGRLQVQLLVDRGRGPEIAASFPMQVGSLPASDDVASNPAAQLQDVADMAGHHGSLLSLLYGLRLAHGLPLPTPTPALMRLAHGHAGDMVQHHFFAHVSRRTGNVTHRLAAAHQPYLHVVENIAEGLGPDEIFAQWMQSPSHRMNLLDPRVNAVGLATVAGGEEAPTVAVLVMAALPQGSE